MWGLCWLAIIQEGFEMTQWEYKMVKGIHHMWLKNKYYMFLDGTFEFRCSIWWVLESIRDKKSLMENKKADLQQSIKSLNYQWTLNEIYKKYIMQLWQWLCFPFSYWLRSIGSSIDFWYNASNNWSSGCLGFA